MKRRYVTMDVFTDRVFSGNPLAVVFDAEGLSDAQMQAIATEFNYAETTFVLPPQDARHTARIRIFTARIEVPFAGHPNIGTAVALAEEWTAQGRAHGDEFLFEEKAGLVPLRLIRSEGQVTAAELIAPESLSVGAPISVQSAASCLSLDVSTVCTRHHPPQVVSIGLPFLAVELVSREALRSAKPDLQAHTRVLPPLGTDAVLAYARSEQPEKLHARVFAPLDATVEDPATGSAVGATAALLASLTPASDERKSWTVEQGVDMGRPSLILVRTVKANGKVVQVAVEGRAVRVMRGEFSLPEERDY